LYFATTYDILKIYGGGFMGYLSFDASIKIHASGKVTSTKTNSVRKGGAYGWAHHVGRAEDQEDGIEWKHSNSDIDSELTSDNESWYLDENGKWQSAEHSEDMAKAVYRRIEYAKQKGARVQSGKNDTVIARGIVLQLDEDDIEDREEWIVDCVFMLEKRFGIGNVPCFAVHRDETSVHIHALVTPVVEKEDGSCSISQTHRQFFSSPKTLAAMHKEFRKELKDKGYDVSMDNKPVEKQLAGYTDDKGVFHAKGLTTEQLKNISERKVELRKLKTEYSLGVKGNAKKEKELDSEKQELEVKRQELDSEKRKFEDEKQAREAFQKAQEDALRKELEEISELKEKLRKTLSKAQASAKKAQELAKEAQEDYLDAMEHYGQEQVWMGEVYKKHIKEANAKSKAGMERTQQVVEQAKQVRRAVERMVEMPELVGRGDNEDIFSF